MCILYHAGVHETVSYWNVTYMTYGRCGWNNTGSLVALWPGCQMQLWHSLCNRPAPCLRTPDPLSAFQEDLGTRLNMYLYRPLLATFFLKVVLQVSMWGKCFMGTSSFSSVTDTSLYDSQFWTNTKCMHGVQHWTMRAGAIGKSVCTTAKTTTDWLAWLQTRNTLWGL